MKILVDTREQKPFILRGITGALIPTERATLKTGDYSLEGLAEKVAVERKSLADLVMCLGRDRARFERELARAAAELEAFAVVVEADYSALMQGRYRSRLNPHSACQTVAAFTVKYGTPFLFAGNRGGAEYATVSFLRQYLRCHDPNTIKTKNGAENGAERGKSNA